MKTLFEKCYKNNGEFKNIDLTLGRIKQALNDVGFNEKRLGHIIHIAGTNGKGSTAHFISEMLRMNGYKVALYTSPHVDNIRERIKFNAIDIGKRSFDMLFSQHRDIIIKNNLTYFEAITLISFVYFQTLNPDFAVIETGLGGRYDATNIFNEKISVITSLSQDHVGVFGPNIFDIIDEKLAIINKDSSPVFIGYNPISIRKYIENKLDKSRIITPSERVISNYQSLYSVPYNENYALAHMLFKHLLGFEYNGSPIKLPSCRFEKISNVILDCSHNVKGILSIMKNFNKKPFILYSATCDRPYDKIIEILSKKSCGIIVTEIPENDRSLHIEDIKNRHIKVIKSLKEALSKILELRGDRDVLITGSIYLCAYTRDLLNKDMI